MRELILQNIRVRDKETGNMFLVKEQKTVNVIYKDGRSEAFTNVTKAEPCGNFFRIFKINKQVNQKEEGKYFAEYIPISDIQKISLSTTVTPVGE